MMRKVSMFMLLFLVSSLLLGLGGCVDVEGDATQAFGDLEGEVPAGLRPDKYWGETWKIKDKECSLETEAERAVFNAYCFMEYQGEKPAEDVQIIIRSPLTGKLIGDYPAESYGTINPGEEIEYRLFQECPALQEALSAGTSERNIVEDFTMNSYLDITWKYDGQEYNVKLFDWSQESS